MKKLILMFFIISIAVTAQEFKRYAFKSGKVVYKSSGSMTGTETMYFDNYGMLEVKNTKASLNLMGIKQVTDTRVIMDADWIYTINNNSGEATKMENPLYSMFPEGGDLEKASADMMISMGGVKTGTETLLGKKCDIWKIEKLMSTIWIWKTIPLKTEVKMMGMNVTNVATSVEVDIKVSPNEFKLPAGVEFKETNSIDINSLMGN